MPYTPSAQPSACWRDLKACIGSTKESDGARGELLGLSTFELPGQAYRQDWVRAAIGAEAALGGGVGSVMLNGTSEGGDADYWLALNYKWLL
jgi:hypothetical protein